VTDCGGSRLHDVSQTFVFRTLALLSLLAIPCIAHAQSYEDSTRIRVDVIPRSPTLDGVLLRGDTALFITNSVDSTAYGFDRRKHRFFRTKAVRDLDPYHRANAATYTIMIADSLTITQVQLSEELYSYVLEDPRGKRIALRGPRVEAEKRWRRAHRLPETPVIENDDEDPRNPHPTDWSPVETFSYAADSNAIWLGLRNERDLYLDFALGGLIRIDRKTRRVTIVEDSAIMHASIIQIEPVRDGFLLIADGSVLHFDPATMRARDLRISPNAIELLVANDTAFIAAEDAIIVADLKSGKRTSRGFRVEAIGDSVHYALSDTTMQASWDTAAIIGVAERFRIKHKEAFIKAARGIVKADALEYYYPGDRISGLEPVENADSASDSDYPRSGPNAVMVTGLEHPKLRQFLRDALLEQNQNEQVAIAKILVTEADTGATPFLRAALASRKDAYRAELATALAALGDTTGNAWIHASLLDTLHSAGTLDTAEKIHPFTFEAAGKLRDPRNVSRLLELAAHPLYGFSATHALLEYRSSDIAERLLPRIVGADSGMVLNHFMDVMAMDTLFPLSVSLRDSVRALARRVIYQPDQRWRRSAVLVLQRLGDTEDLPALIGALTLDQFTYGFAAMALVELTGTGAAIMPDGNYPPLAQRAQAQRWWAEWYRTHQRAFRRAPKAQADAESFLMSEKLRR